MKDDVLSYESINYKREKPINGITCMGQGGEGGPENYCL